jgi:hypothetical protein
MDNNVLPYANSIIRLLQGIIYIDDKEWTELKLNQYEIKNYFSAIGLELFLDETEGYAFLKQKDFSEEENSPIKLVAKRQLTFSVTIICVILRERLLEFDASSSESGRLVLSKEDIINQVQSFYSTESSNEAKRNDKINADINKLIEYGFLKWNNEKKNLLEVKRILRAVFEAEKLNEIKEKLIEYAKRIT